MTSLKPDNGKTLAKARELIFQVSTDLLGSANREGYFTVLNPAWERTFGYSAKALMEKPFIEFVHPADREATTRELSRLFCEPGETIGFENRYAVRKDGWRWLSWNATAVDDAIYFTAHDVTNIVEERSRNHLLSRMVEGVDDAIFTTTIDGIVTSWNRVCQEIYEYDASEAIGRSMERLIFPDDSTGESPGMVERLLGGEGVRQDSAQRRRKGGTTVAISQTASLMRNEQQEVIGMVVVSREASHLSAEELERHGEMDNLIWVGRVRDAIDEGRVVFFAQPILGLRGQSVSYELLCRIKDRNGSIIAPGRFLPAAENYGLIEELDLLGIREAARQIALGHEISVNLSTATVGRRHIVGVIANELQRAGATSDRLTIEITETALMKNMASAQRFTDALAGTGVKLALDDFGTGFGGFTYLKKLSIHRLKIDVEFVKDLYSSKASQHVVKAVVSLAEDFGIDTVAEGVEDAQSAKMLEEYGVGYVQGFYFARPGPIDEVIGETFPVGVDR